MGRVPNTVLSFGATDCRASARELQHETSTRCGPRPQVRSAQWAVGSAQCAVGSAQKKLLPTAHRPPPTKTKGPASKRRALREQLLRRKRERWLHHAAHIRHPATA